MAILATPIGGTLAADAQSADAAHTAQSPDRQADLRELVAVAVRRSVEDLGHPGGFYLRPEYHIGLPATLDPVEKVLGTSYAGLITLSKSSGPLLPVAVEQAINRAAEHTMGDAGDYVAKALPKLRFADPDGMLHGSSDAVAAEVKTQLGPALRDALRPVIRANLDAAKAPEAVERMQARYEQLANRPMPNFDLEAYALDSFMAAFFVSLAEQEANIRTRPSARGSEALKRLFAGM